MESRAASPFVTGRDSMDATAPTDEPPGIAGVLTAATPRCDLPGMKQAAGTRILPGAGGLAFFNGLED